MDDKWFKAQQKRAGVTADEIAARLGKSRTNVSHIYNGRQRMTLEWAQAFSDSLGVPIDEVLRRAGVVMENTSDLHGNTDSIDASHGRETKAYISASNAARIRSSTSSDDATPLSTSPGQEQRARAVADALGQRGGEVWLVNSGAMQLSGYLVGDRILVDKSQSELCKAGDTVLAETHDWNSNRRKIVLRRLDPPVLLADGGPDQDRHALIVDGKTVVIKAKVIASWRS